MRAPQEGRTATRTNGEGERQEMPDTKANVHACTCSTGSTRETPAALIPLARIPPALIPLRPECPYGRGGQEDPGPGAVVGAWADLRGAGAVAAVAEVAVKARGGGGRYLARGGEAALRPALVHGLQDRCAARRGLAPAWRERERERACVCACARVCVCVVGGGGDARTMHARTRDCGRRFARHGFNVGAAPAAAGRQASTGGGPPLLAHSGGRRR